MKECRKAYQRKYQLAWLSARRTKWIFENGPCKKCGSDKNLQVDHIDPSKKAFHPTSLWSKKEETRTLELNKCQVLCAPCHSEKTKKDLSKFFRGRDNYKLRKISDEKFLETQELVKSGLSERSACKQTGMCRGTYSSTKVRGLRVSVFQGGRQLMRSPVKREDVGELPTPGAKTWK